VPKKNKKVQLIINADDYGFSKSVSEGILDAHRTGLVTATGIMANGSYFKKGVHRLFDTGNLDTGVHINITSGYPITKDMGKKLSKWGGTFPGIFKMATAILKNKISPELVMLEFQAQIERCLKAGLVIFFANSHHHVHMLPPLFKRTANLAKHLGIPFVRYTTAEWVNCFKPRVIINNFLLRAFHSINQRYKLAKTPRLNGVCCSGNLTISYIKQVFPLLQNGQIYELMCHPGYLNTDEIDNPLLLRFHHWESELELLKSNEMRDICEKNDLQVIGYRDIAPPVL